MQIKEKSIKLNIIMHFLLNVSSIVLPFLTYPYLSRILKPEGIGTITFFQTFTSYFILISILGIPVYGSRLCSQNRNDKEKLSKIVQELIILSLITTTIAFLVLVIFIFSAPNISKHKIIAFIFASSVIANFFHIQWFFCGIEDFVYLSVRGFFINLSTVVAVFIFVKTRSDYIIYAAILNIGTFLNAAINFSYSKKIISYKKKFKYNFKQHLKPLLRFSLIAIFITLYLGIDRTLLGFMLNDNNYNVGIYESSLKIFRIFVMFLSAFSTVTLSRLSYFYKNKKIEEYKKLIVKTFNFLFVFSIPFVFLAISKSSNAIFLIFGEEFKNSINPFRIIILIAPFSALNALIRSQIIIPQEKEKIDLKIVIIAFFVNLISSTILIFLFNKLKYNIALAPAIALVISELSILSLYFIYEKTLLIELLKKVEWKKILVISFVSLVVSVLIHFIFIKSNILNLFISALIFFPCLLLILIIVEEPLTMYFINLFKAKLLKKFNKDH